MQPSLKAFVKSHESLRIPLKPIFRAVRKVRPSKETRLSSALSELFRIVEGGSLIVRLPALGGSFEINSSSHVLRRILISGDYEPDVARIVKTTVDKNRDAIDIGANIGLFTMLLSTLISASNKVLAVEPAPGALRYLRHNIETNHRTGQVIVFDGVATRHSGEFEIHVIDGMEEYSSMKDMVHPIIRNKPFRKVPVRGKSIDDLVENFALNPGFIKIDTEGAEHDVLLGCRRTISRCRPTILCESWPGDRITAAGGVPGAVPDLLKSHGYLVSKCTNDEILAVPEENRSVAVVPEQSSELSR